MVEGGVCVNKGAGKRGVGVGTDSVGLQNESSEDEEEVWSKRCDGQMEEDDGFIG